MIPISAEHISVFPVKCVLVKRKKKKNTKFLDTYPNKKE